MSKQIDETAAVIFNVFGFLLILYFTKALDSLSYRFNSLKLPLSYWQRQPNSSLNKDAR